MAKASKDVGSVMPQNAGNPEVRFEDLSEFRAKYYERRYNLSLDQVVTTAKWLNASLFAVNSGGLLTVLNQVDKINNPHVAGLAFVAGLIFSLLSATANQEYYNRVGTPLLKLASYWESVRLGEPENEEVKISLEAEKEKVGKFTWVGPTLGWFSGGAFILGAAFIAINIA